MQSVSPALERLVGWQRVNRYRNRDPAEPLSILLRKLNEETGAHLQPRSANNKATLFTYLGFGVCAPFTCRFHAARLWPLLLVSRKICCPRDPRKSPHGLSGIPRWLVFAAGMALLRRFALRSNRWAVFVDARDLSKTTRRRPFTCTTRRRTLGGVFATAFSGNSFCSLKGSPFSSLALHW